MIGAGWTFGFVLMNNGKATEIFKKGTDVPKRFKNKHFSETDNIGGQGRLGKKVSSLVFDILSLQYL